MQNIQCDGPDDSPAAYLVTDIATGEIVALCIPDMADYCQAVLQVVAPDRLAPPPAAAARRPRRKPATTPPETGGGDKSNVTSTEATGGTPTRVG